MEMEIEKARNRINKSTADWMRLKMVEALEYANLLEQPSPGEENISWSHLHDHKVAELLRLFVYTIRGNLGP